jgi:hypothetical protein
MSPSAPQGGSLRWRERVSDASNADRRPGLNTGAVAASSTNWNPRPLLLLISQVTSAAGSVKVGVETARAAADTRVGDIVQPVLPFKAGWRLRRCCHSSICQASRIGTPSATSRARRSRDTANASSAGCPNSVPTPA